MQTVILSPREYHNARSLAELRRKHQAFLSRKRRAGHRVAHHVMPMPVVARIDHGSWVADCPCGAGMAVEPDWGVALCFGCGAEHSITLPEASDRETLEALLLARPHMKNRNWHPSESLTSIRNENTQFGLPAVTQKAKGQ